MDFLQGLQEAIALGISKEEYTDIWKKEMTLKFNSQITSNSKPEGAAPVSARNDKVCNGNDPTVTLLQQIAEKQDIVQQQQIEIQQQLKYLQTLQEREQQKMQQQFEKVKTDVSDKVLALEATLITLQDTFVQCVRKTVFSESLNIQDKLALLTETFHNHILEEIRNTVTAVDSKTTTKAVEMLQGEELQMSEGSTVQDIAPGYVSSGDRETDEKRKTQQTQANANSNTNAYFSLETESSNSLKDVFHYELNSFLVNVQKLLLKPVASEDIICAITERIKELLQCEKNFRNEQLQNVQTAITSDIQSRFHKMEMSFKHELSRVLSHVEPNHLQQVHLSTALEVIEKMKSFIISDLPSTVMTHPAWASILEKINVDVGNETLNQVGAFTKLDSSQPQAEVSSTGKLGQSQLEFAADSEDKWESPNSSSHEKVQIIMLMLSMYVLFLLTEYDNIKGGKTTPDSALLYDKSDSPLYFSVSDKTSQHVESERKESKPAPGSQPVSAATDLTDEHLKLMFGEHKPAHFSCEVFYSGFPSCEEATFLLDDIAPGYNLRLKAQIDDNKIINFYIQALSCKMVDDLLWPAEFNITIALVNTQPLVGLKPKKDYSFTKSKSLFKPMKSTGHSNYIPFCFFKSDIANMFVYEETLTFKISVQFVSRKEDSVE